MLAALLALPAMVALGSALGRPFLPVSDWALIESSVRAVGSGHTPLVGAASRFGWDHPGPWAFYLLAGPYRLIGAAHGILGAAAVWNALTLVALVVVVRRLDRLLSLVAVPVLAVLVLGLGAGFLGDPWNPSLPVLTLALLLPVAWAHARGAKWALPVLAALGSVAVQAHLGFLPVVAAVTIYVIAVRLVTDVRQHRSPWKPFAPLAVTIAVLALAWAPPAIEQVRHDPGNLSNIVHHVVHPPPALTPEDAGTVGAAGAASLFARQFGVPAPWLGAAERREVVSADRTAGNGHLVDLLPLALALGAALVIGFRRRDRAALTLLGLCLTAMAGCYLGLAVIRGIPFEWLVRWCRPVAAWAWIAAMWTGARALLARAPVSHRAAILRRTAPVAVVLVAAASLATVFATTLGQRPDQARAELAARLAPRVLAATRAYDGVFLVLVLAPGAFPQETNGLLVAYQRAGRRATNELQVALRGHYPVGVGLSGDPPSIARARAGAYGQRVLFEVDTGLTRPGEPRRVAVIIGPLK